MGYPPHLAEKRYRARRRGCRRRPRLRVRALRQLVVDLRQRGLSPEQIAGRLRAEQGRTVVNPETIHRSVYKSPLGRQEQQYLYLRRGKKIGTRRQGRQTRSQPIAGRLLMDARPAAATERRAIGHWESDSQHFAEEQVVNVLVERSSRCTFVTRLRNKPARESSQALISCLTQLPRLSPTADNGLENADHVAVARALSLPVCFCRP